MLRLMKKESLVISLQKLVIDDIYQNGTLSDEEYNEQIDVLDKNTDRE